MSQFEQFSTISLLSGRVRAFLGREFPDRCVGRGRRISWSLPSSTLAPLDFSSGLRKGRNLARKV
jgi:hypothetical protein